MIGTPEARRYGSAGFTLIELLVSLALFALISLAGVRLVETIVGVQQRSAGRAERLGEVQRAIYLVTADFEQLTAGPERDGDRVRFTRGSGEGGYDVSYRFAGQALHRIASGTDRAVLTSLSASNWRFLKDGAWTDQPVTRERKDRPRAIELTIELQPGPGRMAGTLRRVIELPRQP